MTDIAVSRAGRTVIAAHEVTGLPIRAYECRNVHLCGHTITVTDGKRTRRAFFGSTEAAKKFTLCLDDPAGS